MRNIVYTSPRKGLLLGVSAFILCALSPPSIAVTSESDLESLKLIPTRSHTNLEKIQTWQGRARIRTKWLHHDPPADKPTKQTTDVEVTFVYDSVTGNIRSNCVLKESRNYHADGSETTYLSPDVYTMVRGGTYYRFCDTPPSRKGLARRVVDGWPAPIQVETSGKNYRRSVMIYEFPPGDLARQHDHFNPVCRQFPKRENIIDSAFEHFYKLLKDKKEDLPKRKVVRSGSIVRFWIGPSEDTCNIYEVGLSKGASIVAYRTLIKGKVTASWTNEPQLVNGVWIPRRTVRRLDSEDLVREETTTWLENTINNPIADEEFTLAKMKLHRGDKIHDKRTGKMTTITGTDLSPPAKPVIPESGSNGLGVDGPE